MNKLFFLSLYTILLSGCSTTDAVFVTKTSISVLDIDNTPPSISFAYDRAEGFFGPNYENGAAPSAVAFIRTDGSIISPTIKQIYATGEAASIVVDPSATTYPVTGGAGSESNKLKGERKSFLFGTSTTLGFKIGMSQEMPSFTLGYKRKEASYIPLRKSHNGTEDHYTSVLASIDNSVIIEADGQKYENGQFFATGEAAKRLATHPEIKLAFKKRAEDALGKFDKQFSQQLVHHSGISRCLFKLDVEQWDNVVTSGIAANLISGAEDVIIEKYEKYKVTNNEKEQLELIKYYSSAIAANVNPESTEYTALLKKHEELICN